MSEARTKIIGTEQDVIGTEQGEKDTEDTEQNVRAEGNNVCFPLESRSVQQLH